MQKDSRSLNYLIVYLMPHFCMVVACGSNSARDSVSFFRIPSEYDNHKQFDKLESERQKAYMDKPL
ncbi:hypothetical protein NQ317_004602 [Molorchus minor]|uniref:Uncharacterized protein n=1 Tax=Molorchus minor TaxID=1323400 RepID=A0ABQ9IYA4_9CUCU|nr:hypothetical protein NQ317_004602 [Molorchus minor]